MVSAWCLPRIEAGRPQLYEIAGGPMRRLRTQVSRYCAETGLESATRNKLPCSG